MTLLDTSSRRALALAFTAALFCAAPAAAFAQKAPVQISLPIQPLDKALTEVSRQTGVDILFSRQDVAGQTAAAINGRMSAADAVQRLIAGKPLRLITTPSGALAVQPSRGKVAPEAARGPQGQGVEAATAVDEVIVEGYRVGATAGGTRIVTPLKDLPMSVQVVNQELIQDLGARKIEDAIRYVSGINKVNRNDGLARNERFAIRGFNSSLIMRNGVPYNVFSETANIQQIDVVKGANSILYGFNDPGGLINYTTRAPKAEAAYGVVVTGGSFDFYRAEGDATGKLVGDTNYRLMGAYTDAGSWLKNGMEKTLFVNPVVDVGLTDKTRLLIDYEYRRQNSRLLRDGYPTLYDMAGTRIGYADLGSRYSPIFPTNRSINTVQNMEVRLTHQFTDDVTLRVVGAHTEIDSDQFNTLSGDLLRGSDRLTQTRTYLELNKQLANFAFADLSARFDTFGAIHKVIVGAQHLRREGKSFGLFSGYGPIWDITTSDPAIRYAIPATRAQLAKSIKFIKGGPTESSGVFAIDQLTLPDERTHILVGARYDKLNGVSKTTPQIGVNYEINTWLSAYALYSESFRLNGSYTYMDTGEVVIFPPEEGQNREVGFKLDLFDRRLSGTVAVFDLKRANVLQITASPNPLRPFINLSDGERSRGVEVDVAGKIGSSLTVYGSYAYTDTKVLASTNPAVIGAPLEGVAKNAVSGFAKYDLGEVGPGRLSVNMGVLWRQGPILLLNNVPADSGMRQDSYTVLDAGVDYALADGLMISLKGTNVGGTEYMDRRSAYAAPAQYSLTLRKAF